MRRLILGTLVVLILAGAVSLAACKTPTPEPTPTPVPGRAPAAFAEGAFPPPISVREEHKNPWQIPDCLTCHKVGSTVATEIPHPEWTSNCRSCHVPAEQTAEY